ncbi:MAG: SIS domain-containing protein [Oscillospiraceae bacterium]|nr:SIS domain-containing protein [Oscillospiraceae bacterium]
MSRYDESINKILNIEWTDIKKLIDTLDRGVMEQIIDLLLTVRENGRKVITAGCGTSGATAVRVAHSLNVCEVPSFFLDPSMSIHGGFGAIQRGDVVILFSKGGNTPEVTNYIPVCRKKGATIIGVSQNDDSVLAKLADIYFKIQIDTESDKFNMCASASCTAYCAVWDAIAFTIMQFNGYTKEDLLLIHTGGKVGELLAEENKKQRENKNDDLQ